MDKPKNPQPGDSVVPYRNIISNHAGEHGWIEDVFVDGISVHFPTGEGFEFWQWNEIEAYCPKVSN